MESEDEEEVGQLKEEDGEDVAVVDAAKVSKKKKLSVDCEAVEVNIEEVRLPSGKWRVVTRHVPENRLLVVRYATGFDIRRGIIDPVSRTKNSYDLQEKKKNVDQDGFEYSWMTKKDKVRPGLNIFDDKGRELDWDYEHDTRFYEETPTTNIPSAAHKSSQRRKRSHSASSSNTDNQEEQVVEKQPEIVQIAGVKIRSRGRGTKKFFAFAQEDEEAGDTDQKIAQSLASDEVEVGAKYGSVKEQANEGSTEQDG
uniref:Uncharacterized protein n=1 Tax=Ditylenchus dipsaci TaxID=166011 RepID=A0A915CTS5_9BILA